MYYTQTNRNNPPVGNCGAFATAFYLWEQMDGFIPIEAPADEAASILERNTSRPNDQALVDVIYNYNGVRLKNMPVDASGATGSEILVGYYREITNITDNDELFANLAAVDAEDDFDYYETLDKLIDGLGDISLPTGLRQYLIDIYDMNGDNIAIHMPRGGDNNIDAFRGLLEYYDHNVDIRDEAITYELLKKSRACMELVYVGTPVMARLHYVLSFKNSRDNTEILYIDPWDGYTKVRTQNEDMHSNELGLILIPTGAGILIR